MKKIGWQKYEDYIEKQLTSPMLTNIVQNIVETHINNTAEEIEDEDDYEDDEDDKKSIRSLSPFLPITNQLIDDITMLSSFDCWIGHTNFDLTIKIKNVIDKIPGVELLKIYSRYRFFIGIGQMFDFKEVRKNIEEALIEGD